MMRIKNGENESMSERVRMRGGNAFNLRSPPNDETEEDLCEEKERG